MPAQEATGFCGSLEALNQMSAISRKADTPLITVDIDPERQFASVN
jgi:hypothetical protein